MTRRPARPVAALLALSGLATGAAVAIPAQAPVAGNPEQKEVRIEAFVHHDGEPVRVSSADTLEVFVDDRPAVFRHDPAEPLSVLAVVDLSASVAGPRLRAVGSGVAALLTGLGAGDRCALLSFTRSLELHSRWEEGCGAAAEAAAALRGGGPAALNNALTLALGLLAEAPGRPVLALFTDGVDGASWTRDTWPLFAAAGNAPLVLAVTAPPVVGAGGVGGVYGTVSREDLENSIVFEGRTLMDRGRDLRGLRNTDPFWVLEELARRSGGALVRTGGEPAEIESAIAGLGARIRERLSLRLDPAAFAPGPRRVRVTSPAGEVRHTASFAVPARD